MAIRGVSDVLRLPRLGKIRLGIKVEPPGKNPYPKAVDHFVCPPEVQEVFGEEPKELEIMFPVENPAEFAQQFLRAYSMTQGLICIGDGVSARQKVDTQTKQHADHNTQDWEWVEGLVCDPQECPLYAEKRCRRVLNLQFLLPKCSGLGVWQIDSTSFYSIVNINSMIALVKSLCGRISMIPLTLVLGPIDVTPQGMKKKTVYVMHIKQDIRLADLQQLALTPPAQMLIPEPEVEEPPSDLFPDEVIEGKGEVQPPEGPPTEAPEDNTQARRIAGWALIREIQQKLDMEDIFVKSAFKHQFPELKGQIPRSALPDKPPDWATLEQIMAMARRLQEYQQKVTSLSGEELPTGPTEEKEPSAATPQSAAPPLDPDHPWEQTKRGEGIEPGGEQPPPAEEPSTDEIDS